MTSFSWPTRVTTGTQKKINKESRHCSTHKRASSSSLFRFLISLGDYRESTVVLWSGFDGHSSPVVVASAKTTSPVLKVTPSFDPPALLNRFRPGRLESPSIKRVRDSRLRGERLFLARGRTSAEGGSSLDQVLCLPLVFNVKRKCCACF